jgi:glucosylceramidase
MSKLKYFLFALGVGLISGCKVDKSDIKDNGSTSAEVEYWVTTPDKSFLLTKMSGGVKSITTSASLPVVEIDTLQKYQVMDGFGFALTGGSAQLINQKLTTEKRSAILKELFSTEGNGIGVSYLRISIGASDLDETVFSYCDLPAGKTDLELKQFSIEEDEKNLIPVIKEILKINPNIKIMGSPWSAPTWMKDNNKTIGGSLLPRYYSAYSNYFVKYIQAMEQQGIMIDAITIQNEPENPKNNPSMVMTAEEQSEFIQKHLGPAFTNNGISTKIILFDHNCDHPEYAISILNNQETRKYVNGSAFHLYLGEIDALSKVNEAHPDKSLYFTEQWTSPEGKFGSDLEWHTKHLTIGASRNWSKNVLEWNLAADPEFNPHTDGGCTQCQGALTIDGNNVTKNVSYYIIGHASKFITPGSVRVASTSQDSLSNVAFKRPDGKIALLLLNESNKEQDVAIRSKNNAAVLNLPAKAVATVVMDK